MAPTIPVLETARDPWMAALSSRGPLANLEGSASGEDFDCTHLEEWNVRFSDPGFVAGRRVGLFYRYIGVPQGDKTLQIYWDEAERPGEYQMVRLGSGEIWRDDDTRFDLEGIIERTYPDIVGPTEKQVRANLIVEDLTGNCPTVRRVHLTPELGDVNLCRGVIDFDSVATGTPVPFTVDDVTFAVFGPPGTQVDSAATFVPFVTLTGNYLIQRTTPAGPITVTFAQPQTSYRFLFATPVPTSFTVDGFLGVTPVFSTGFTSAPMGQFAEGVASGGGASFDRLVLSAPGFAIALDDVAVSCP